MVDKIINKESEFHEWFLDNYKKLGYEKMIRKDKGVFPDFIMLKNGKEIGVELETLSSNFINHKHNEDKVNELLCIKNDIQSKLLNIPIIEVKELTYINLITRISATIDEKTAKKLDVFMKGNTQFRNKSHCIEYILT